MTTKLRLAILGVALAAGIGFWLFENQRTTYSPYFGNVVLGPDEAKPDAQLNFIVLGRKIYLDENQDGVADTNEFLINNELPKIQSADGRTVYHVEGLGLGIEPDSVSEKLPQQLEMQVRVQLENGFHFLQGGNLLMSLQPLKDNGLHFNGPMEMVLDEPPTVITKEGRPTEYPLMVATQTKAGESGNQYRPAVLAPEADRDTVPQLKIKYPAGDSGSPLIEDLMLDHFC